MRVLFNLVVMSALFVSYNAAESNVADTSHTMNMLGEGTTTRRLRRYEYTMKDLDKTDNSGGEERGAIDVSKLDDALNSKLGVLVSPNKKRKALNDIDDEAGLFKKLRQDEATSKAVLAKLQKTTAESPTNSLSKSNTFIMKEKQLDDLMSADKIEKALV
ncbi:RxLR effector protein, partial [Phytophthora megakarya]